MSDLNEKKEITKEEFAANEIKAFCAYVMHPESDLHKDANDWIKERLQANGDNASDSGLHLQRVSVSVAEILKPEYANTVFTWKQVEDAIKLATER